MQHTSCTEDRIQHLLDRCLDGLRQSPTAAHHWNVLMCSAGQSMNRWSLEELVKRDPENFIILLQQILKKTKEVQEQCQYELVAPLAIMFSSTLLQTPYCPPDKGLIEKAIEVFRCFLTWPEPYCSVCKDLLSTLQLEIKAPGISFQRLVREEQFLNSPGQSSKTMTVLLMNPCEVPADFLSVAEQLSRIQHSQEETYINLIKHAFQSALGTKYPLQSIHRALQAKNVNELGSIFSTISDILEAAAAMKDPVKGRSHVIQGLEQLRESMRVPASNGRRSDGMLQTLPLPTAKCYMFHWEKDNFDVLNTLLEHEPDDQETNGRRPILSSDEDNQNTTLRVVVFGADHVAGKVARAYNSLRRKESACPRLSRVFRLQFYFVPVKRDSAAGQGSLKSHCPVVQSPKGAALSNDPHLTATGDSTNDIANLLGMLDPWYERNTLGLMNLPANVVCQQTSKTESESYDSSYEQRLPILADLVLYYCRNASRPTLIQLYQAELTLADGERRTEVFVHSLELGHTAGTRAIKAMGAASKRFGIDSDREAVPLKLEVVSNRVVISGRSQWKRETKVCTSVNVTKACKNPEELDAKMECLQLTMTEVLKRQSGKCKKGYNQQLSTTEVKVDKVQVSGAENTTFAVCLDQDEKKILQSVTRCDISVCYKPDSSTDWRLRKAPSSAQIQPLNPTFCSLLCLPIVTFSGALP
ncbi:Phosphoinositide 3-kinase regulatory subunit 5 [Dissostichus eleginoides]|uniref:Phosphoinositide 3-kinase regulatory subunit 5 n=1 Tax=Dissostichus eleginoides TaxID=100907 RepID=A0AAD9BQK1_DISEL|nr:Phosphoinositide 3-kinase regulatory subunit 5 [Dissostichus eleginoides]